MNGKKPLTLDYKTFVEFAGLDYGKGKYVSHPSTEEVLGGNYSSTKQVNSIQQLFAYYLLIGTKGPEASGTLPHKRKKPKSKKPPTKTKVIPHPSQRWILSNPTQSPRASLSGKQEIHMGLTSMVSYEAVAKITSLPKGPLGDKESKGNKTPVDMELINPTVADLSGTGAKYHDELTQESNDEEVFVVGEDMDEDTEAAKEEL
ncbi:hypothetical protein Tco_0312201 [Tanacetum coccineum]